MPSFFSRSLILSYLIAPVVLLGLWLSFDVTLGLGATSRKIQLVWLVIQLIGASGPVLWLYLRLGSEQPIGRPAVALIAIWFWMLVCSVLASFTGLALSARGMLIDLTLASLWLSIFWTFNALIQSPEHFRFLMGGLRFTGLAVTGSVYLGFVLYRFRGIEFGEVVSSDETTFFRCFGPLGDHVGFVILLFLMLSLARGRWIEAIVHVGAIVLTSTRGAMIAAVVGTLWLGFNRTEAKSRTGAFLGTIVMFAVVAMAGLAYGLSSAGETSASRIMDAAELSQGAGSRVVAFRLAFNVLMANPILGTGWGGFRDHWQEYADMAVTGSEQDMVRGTFYAQNQLLQFGADGGVPAMLLYGFFVVTVLRASRRTLRDALSQDQANLRGMDAFLGAILVGNQSAVWFSSYSSTGFFVMMTAGAVLAYGANLPATRPQAASVPEFQPADRRA